jgi:hypothetical protein
MQNLGLKVKNTIKSSLHWKQFCVKMASFKKSHGKMASFKNHALCGKF